MASSCGASGCAVRFSSTTHGAWPSATRWAQGVVISGCGVSLHMGLAMGKGWQVKAGTISGCSLMGEPCVFPRRCATWVQTQLAGHMSGHHSQRAQGHVFATSQARPYALLHMASWFVAAGLLGLPCTSMAVCKAWGTTHMGMDTRLHGLLARASGRGASTSIASQGLGMSKNGESRVLPSVVIGASDLACMPIAIRRA